MTALSLSPLWSTVITTLHALGWAIYVGGAITMELVLRYAQDFMRPSQTAVVCQFSGKRYRWWSFYCLLVLLVTGIALEMTEPMPFDLSTTRGLTVWALCGLWIMQIGVLGLLAFWIHPAMHARLSSDMTGEQMRRERERVGVAIKRMDRTVRLELCIALAAMLVGSFLHIDSIGTTTGS